MSKKTKQVKKDSKSNEMRNLYKEGMSVADISRKLDVCYSFTYQVCQRFSKKSGDEKFDTNQPESIKQSDNFREDFDAGMNVGEIAKKYNANYSWVWTVVDNHRKAKV